VVKRRNACGTTLVLKRANEKFVCKLHIFCVFSVILMVITFRLDFSILVIKVLSKSGVMFTFKA
jgi:hypothetical protein